MSKYKTPINEVALERIERNRSKRDANRTNHKSVFEIRSTHLQNKEIMRNFVSRIK